MYGKGLYAQFLLQAVQAEITLTTGMTQGLQGVILAYFDVIFDTEFREHYSSILVT
jgi:hypothetical protein